MLKGLKVLEFDGLAPSVFCGLYFADQGADVILVARPEPAPLTIQIHKNIMNRNKKCIKLSLLKNSQDRKVLNSIIEKVDIIIDPYRPGVLEKENLGPEELYKLNKKILLLRVTGYGQQGDMSLRPGHDLNYIASSGILKSINASGSQEKMQFPSNFLADFVSASLGITNTLKALKLRKTTGEGYVVDCSLAGGCSYLASMVKSSEKRNNNRLVYYEANGKRYIITCYSNQTTISQNDIKRVVQQMIRNKEDFRKENDFQIAQIKKIQKIKQSTLKNPFQQVQSQQIKNKIPLRDQNREQILSQFLRPQARL